ncbi:hypothetical protein PoB_002645800 [Plakobranchus ocellatus]|uniref:Uncharacterized protein n=1 Tax=Plakobranchus ocellatus TaxID=259542 RepID=A0AAV3ZZX9_9GAST|nr:hypothetical protein PoB_002645800 [Plakobranchus ocellatus]
MIGTHFPLVKSLALNEHSNLQSPNHESCLQLGFESTTFRSLVHHSTCERDALSLQPGESNTWNIRNWRYTSPTLHSAPITFDLRHRVTKVKVLGFKRYLDFGMSHSSQRQISRAQIKETRAMANKRKRGLKTSKRGLENHLQRCKSLNTTGTCGAGWFTPRSGGVTKTSMKVNSTSLS